MARALMIFITLLVASAVPVPQRKNKGSLAADDAFEAALAEAAHELAAVPEAAPEAAPEVAQEAAQVAALAKEVAPAAEQEAAPAAAATNETHVVCPSKTCTSASKCPKLLGSARCVCGRCEFFCVRKIFLRIFVNFAAFALKHFEQRRFAAMHRCFRLSNREQ